jgi:hypothetical protein
MLPYINRQLSRSYSNQVTEEIPLYRGLVTLQTLHEKVKVKLRIHVSFETVPRQTVRFAPPLAWNATTRKRPPPGGGGENGVIVIGVVHNLGVSEGPHESRPIQISPQDWTMSERYERGRAVRPPVHGGIRTYAIAVLFTSSEK